MCLERKRRALRNGADSKLTLSKRLRQSQTAATALLQRIDTGPTRIAVPRASMLRHAQARGVNLESDAQVEEQQIGSQDKESMLLEADPPPLLSKQAQLDKAQLWVKSISTKQMWRPIPRRRQFRGAAVLQLTREGQPKQPISYAEYLECLPDSPAADAYEDASIAERTGLGGLDLLRRLTGGAKGIPPLTDEERELAVHALDDRGSPDEVLVSRFSVDVTRRQLSCLLPSTWLNDEVVNFYCKLLQERCDRAAGSSTPSCWFTNTFFWGKLSGEGGRSYSYKDVKRWTVRAKVDIFTKDFVIFPINVNSMHWTCGAINLRDKCFYYLDSMDQSPPSTFVPFLRRYLNDEHLARKGTPLEGVDSWCRVHIEVPQQSNGYDCGVFTCCFAECLASGAGFAFDQDDIHDMRLRLAARIVSGNSEWSS
mmetsp:Transcript_4881/g.10776  ORF Transcript_4881/g.10776 Transcript_4881/m.10776 type:complete len:425 (-) Transcript_4881:19-1293(-)